MINTCFMVYSSKKKAECHMITANFNLIKSSILCFMKNIFSTFINL